MKLSNIPLALSMFLAALCLPAQAQSVKDIINDQTGQYIYAQARDEDSESAMGLASDELASRVESYLGSNKMKKYNRNWKEWVKRIINEKYGRTRVFLYLSVNDLKPEAEALTAPKQDYIGGSSSVEKAKPANNKSLKEKEINNPLNEKVEEVKETSAKTEEPTVIKQAEPIPEEVVSTDVVEAVVPEEIIEVEETMLPEDSTDTEAPKSDALPGGLLGDVISRIINGGVNGDISSQLSRGKNLKVISMYGDNNSKYIPHAYIITNDSGNLRIYTPQNKEGMRTDLTDNKAVTTMSGKMMYWFLKK